MKQGDASLADADSEIFQLILQEKHRQVYGIELIASENFVTRAVTEALATCPTNKYSEGIPGKRYYGGNEVIDNIEWLCEKRALELYGLDAKVWGVNVQPYSGSPANLAVFTALLHPGDRIMGLNLPSGGHLSHGYRRNKRAVSAAALFWQSMPYSVSGEDGLIDFAEFETIANAYQPNLIIAGGSAYPRDWDYERFRKIADKHKAFLLCDMAHIAGLVAAGEQKSPFDYCDVVTTTTHKTLRGPRGAMIFYKLEHKAAINRAVFPMLQGGPHENTIAAIAVALREANTDEFRAYAKQVRLNAKRLASELEALGHTIVSGGTDNHLLLWNVRDMGLTGSKLEKVFELAAISVNKNSIHGDKSAISPGGVRLGSPAMTSRGLKEDDFAKIAAFLDRGAKIALQLQEKSGKKLKDFLPLLEGNAEILALKADVEKWAGAFPMPGIARDLSKIKA
eukprot:TRINITY_DN5076_c0_g1_i2.p1 TRINITY_DN5076_c0_g1~~TRINITY_DN5076_c0_g1_i2.p1  ORF type:complete len:459 (-),score=87.93 TRINITY_DN5076_c0_g1_i2:46-1401(-)